MAAPQPKQRPADFPVTITCKEMDRRQIGGGVSSWLVLLPGGTRVRKAVQPWIAEYERRMRMVGDMRNEIEIYNHLPKGHPRFLEMLASYDHGDAAGDVGIDLEYLPNGSLRTYLEENHVEFVHDDSSGNKSNNKSPVIPPRLRARWAVELVDGIGFLHTHGVLHCDVKPPNVLLDSTLGLRIIDLAGSRLGDRPPRCCGSMRFYMPRARAVDASVTTDLFAVGMSLYEIVTGAQPYGLITDYCEIVNRYKRQQFPSLAVEPATSDAAKAGNGPVKFVTKVLSKDPNEVGHNGSPANTSAYARSLAPANARGTEVLFADAMRRCWHGQFASAADLQAALAEEIRAVCSDEDIAYIEAASGLSLKA